MLAGVRAVVHVTNNPTAHVKDWAVRFGCSSPLCHATQGQEEQR
jgi:hypothetical protein